jgi:hypothetical protein
MRTSNRDPSNRILALTNKHVASIDPFTEYDSKEDSFNKDDVKHIVVCGDCCLACAIAEIEDAIKTGLHKATNLAVDLAKLELKLGMDNSSDLQHTQNVLDNKNIDNATLQMLLAKVNAQWKDTSNPRPGSID